MKRNHGKVHCIHYRIHRCIQLCKVSKHTPISSSRWRRGILRIRAGTGRWINRKGGGAERFQVYELAAERERLCILASFLLLFLLKMFFYLKDSPFFCFCACSLYICASYGISIFRNFMTPDSVKSLKLRTYIRKHLKKRFAYATIKEKERVFEVKKC